MGPATRQIGLLRRHDKARGSRRPSSESGPLETSANSLTTALNESRAEEGCHQGPLGPYCVSDMSGPPQTRRNGMSRKAPIRLIVTSVLGASGTIDGRARSGPAFVEDGASVPG